MNIAPSNKYGFWGSLVKGLIPTAMLLALNSQFLEAQPEPGDIFREYHYTSDTIIELDPSSNRDHPKLRMRRDVSHRPRSLDIWDLEDAVRAEIALEFWGGHVGTSDYKVKVNRNDWIPIPQIEGTPTNPLCYFRNQLGSVIAPLSLEQLEMGLNTFEFTCGPQICYSFDWGIFKVYSFTVRIYYNETKSRPDARLTSHQGGTTIGESPAFEIEAHGAEGNIEKTEFTHSDVAKVEYVGLYKDFDWEGNGVFRQWHYQLEQGELKRHIGSSETQPYRVSWDTLWIPDQEQPVGISAFVTDTHGITYMMPAVELNFLRTDRSVKMYPAHDVPERFGVRAGKRMACKIAISDDPAKASSGRLFLSTWAGGHANAIGFNEKLVVERTGNSDFYGYSSEAVSPAILTQGDNEFFIFSDTKHHAAEVNWPGPVLMLEFLK